MNLLDSVRNSGVNVVTNTHDSSSSHSPLAVQKLLSASPSLSIDSPRTPRTPRTPSNRGAAAGTPRRLKRAIVQKYTGHSSAILDVCLAVVADEEYLFTGSQDWSARAFEVSTGNCIRHFEGHEAAISAVCFHTNGFLYTTSHDGTAIQWDVTTGLLSRRFTPLKVSAKLGDRGLTSLCIMDDVLFSGSRDPEHSLLAWELDSDVDVAGTVLATGHAAGISALCCSSTGSIFSGGHTIGCLSLLGAPHCWIFRPER